MMGFSAGTRTNMEPIPGKGIRITSDPCGSTKIYQRTYNQRKNNPLESLIDIQNQGLIETAIPAFADRIHVQMTPGDILIRALANESFAIRKKIATSRDPFNSLVALTGGVDIHCMRQLGFTIGSILEYRPQEARDKNDLTETGALNAMANCDVKYLFNEDINQIDWNYLARVLERDEPVSFVHCSPQCDEFSTAKNLSSREASIATLETSMDMVYDVLRLVETVRPAVVMVENVPSFGTSSQGELLRVKLRKWGYYVEDATMDARQFGGLTSRKRYYLVASVWPGFSFPQPLPLRNDLWKVIDEHFEDCRDISHTATIYEGIKSGRARIIRPDSQFAPTVMKSQNRQTKDSVYFEKDGRYYIPSEALLRDLNGIPEDFNLETVSSTIASEIIGQSIEYPMHHSILKNVRNHIAHNSKGITIQMVNREPERLNTLVTTKPESPPPPQLNLF
jgi:DNA (cytosine-5)-methyltransferase 1